METINQRCSLCKKVTIHETRIVLQVGSKVCFSIKCRCGNPIERVYKTSISNWNSKLRMTNCQRIM